MPPVETITQPATSHFHRARVYWLQCLSRPQWQREAEGRACAFAALKPELALGAFDDLMGEIQADAESGVGIDFL